MKKLLIPGILACATLVGHTGQPSLADKKQSDKAAKWEQVTVKLEDGKEVNVLVLKLWDSAAADPKWPQLALARLPPSVYNVFRNDSKALKTFVEGTQTGKPLFDASVTITENCVLPGMDDGASKGETSSLVMLSHRVSHVSCTALQEQAIRSGY
jgi:hypothetical protein